MKTYKLIGKWSEPIIGKEIVLEKSDSNEIYKFENSDEFDNWVTENEYNFWKNYVIKEVDLGGNN